MVASTSRTDCWCHLCLSSGVETWGALRKYKKMTKAKNLSKHSEAKSQLRKLFDTRQINVSEKPKTEYGLSQLFKDNIPNAFRSCCNLI